MLYKCFFIIVSYLTSILCINLYGYSSDSLAILQKSQTLPSHVLVIFGATGDLTKRKLIPALVELARKDLLPKEYIWIGVGRRGQTQEQFHTELSSFLSSQNAELWEQMKTKIHYVQGDFGDNETYLKLNRLIKKPGNGPAHIDNYLYFLATPSANFAEIIQQLNAHELLTDTGVGSKGWSRVLIEKPFGSDLDSAEALKSQITQLLNDEQIYHIDHYLGKEVVRNLITLRFMNPVFNSIWNSQHIGRVDIVLSEEIGVGSRGAFWEQTGLLRDLLQNHIMQIVSLIAMERPADFSADKIRKQKELLLESIRPFEKSGIDQTIVRGQYGPGIVKNQTVPGYRQEAGVPLQSNIETYVAAKLFIDNQRWMDVPFYITAGKRLDKKIVEIVITFKPVGDYVNKLHIQVQPKEEMYMTVNCLKPVFEEKLHENKLWMQFAEPNELPAPDAYERLFYDVLQGDRSNFASFEEIMAAWRLFTPVLKHWKANPPKDFPNYAAGSQGPSLTP